eukprot:3013639-Amphidinium_carterae.1
MAGQVEPERSTTHSTARRKDPAENHCGAHLNKPKLLEESTLTGLQRTHTASIGDQEIKGIERPKNRTGRTGQEVFGCGTAGNMGQGSSQDPKVAKR